MSNKLLTEFQTAADVFLFQKALKDFSYGEVDVPDVEYCGWLPEKTQSQKLLKQKVQSKYPDCCFNHKVGLPTLKFEDRTESEPNELNLYEKRIIELCETYSFYALNKCRGAGATEVKTVRHNAFKYIKTHIPGRKCLIVAGLNQDVANVMLGRIKDICDKIPEVYLFEPRSDNPNAIVFKTGGMILSLPARPNAVRSFENVGDLDYEEAAFWNLLDDKPVLKAGEPHVTKSNAHVNHLTTPNGKKGFYWDDIFDPEIQSKYFKHVLNWREVIGIPEPDPNAIEDFDLNDRPAIAKFYKNKLKNDKEYKQWFNNFFGPRDIDEILNVASPILDIREIIRAYNFDRPTYDQEYDNQFILSENRAFGEFMEEDFAPINFDESDFE